MSYFLGIAETRFDEPSLKTTRPLCLIVVAAILAAGWKLANDGNPNHEDVLIGPLHVQDFKRCRSTKLVRRITWRWQQKTRTVLGERMQVRGFVQRCLGDRAFLNAQRALPNYQHYYNQVASKYPAAPGLKAKNSARQVVVPQHGDPAWIKQFAESYENGF